VKGGLWCLSISFVSFSFATWAGRQGFIGSSIADTGGGTTVVLDWLKAREKLNPTFCVLERIKGGLRKDKPKTIVGIIGETMFDFKGVGTYESEVSFIQKLSL
jgi:hypothetical protein